MPEGSKGQKRPRDMVGNAIAVAKIATREIEEFGDDIDEKDQAAKSMERRGSQARARKLAPQRRSEIAKKAARARYAKDD